MELRERLQNSLGSEITLERELEGGGMSRVFVARDSTLGREIVVKVLRPELASSVSAERFKREIAFVATLYHPNIVPLLWSGAVEGLPYYTMPFVRGTSLRAKLAVDGRLSVTEVLHLLRDIASALAYAHSAGVVHRDIKPENVLLAGGVAVVTDFGVSKAVDAAVTATVETEHQLTSRGVALGTPPYMSPEQASADHHIDHRSDIYSFGCVAYEMLAGASPFAGRAPQQMLAAHIIEPVVPLGTSRTDVPLMLERLVMRCLEKGPSKRPQSAEELLGALTAIAALPVETRPSRGVLRHRWRLAVAGAVISLAVAAFVSWTTGNSTATLSLGAPRSVTREEGLEVDPAISPDGRTLAYAAQGPTDSAMRIYVRAADGGNPVRVSGNLPGQHRFVRWSPDGSQLLFSVLGRGLYTIPRFGGAPRLVSDTVPVLFGAWSPDGQSVVYGARQDWLSIQTADRRRRTLRGLGTDVHSPTWSPDGRWIAYVSLNGDYPVGPFVNKGPSAIYVIPAVGGIPIRLTDADHLHLSPVWLPDSRGLLFVSDREGGSDIYHLRVDANGRRIGPLERLTTDLHVGMIDLSQDAKQLAYSVVTHDESNIWSIAISPGDAAPLSKARPITTGTQHVEALSISKDGEWIAFDSDRDGTFDIFKMRIAGGEPLPLTRDTAHDFHPEWSPDGRWIAFHTWRSGSRDVYVVSSDGTGLEHAVVASPGQDYRATWAADGRRLVMMEERTISIVERSESGTWGAPRRLTSGNAPQWSPDGGAIAYIRTDGLRVIAPDGTNERIILRRPFTHHGATYDFGFARWSPDGKTIYVKSQSRVLFWAVPAAGGAPRPLVVVDDARQSPRAEFATDGRRLYFPIANRQADIRIVALNRR